jgi:mono/diheme cytochrome c family protein
MRFLAVVLLAVLAACAEPPAGTVPGRWYTAAQADAGATLYRSHCAQCHGGDGSATADWRSPDEDGVYPPPPLDGSAHTWHHPLEVLTGTIANGGAEFGGVMPGFGGQLDADERLAVVAWIQSLWSDDIYRRWQEIDKR